MPVQPFWRRFQERAEIEPQRAARHHAELEQEQTDALNIYQQQLLNLSHRLFEYSAGINYRSSPMPTRAFSLQNPRPPQASETFTAFVRAHLPPGSPHSSLTDSQFSFLRDFYTGYGRSIPVPLFSSPMKKPSKHLVVYVKKGDPKGVLWLKLPHGADLSICGSYWWTTFQPHLLQDHELEVKDPSTVRQLFLAALKLQRERIKHEGAYFGERDPEMEEFEKNLEEADEEMIIDDVMAEDLRDSAGRDAEGNETVASLRSIPSAFSPF